MRQEKTKRASRPSKSAFGQKDRLIIPRGPAWREAGATLDSTKPRWRRENVRERAQEEAERGHALIMLGVFATIIGCWIASATYPLWSVL